MSSAAKASISSTGAGGGAGFTSADIGRLIRLFSQPALWDPAASYTTGQIVTYEADGEAVENEALSQSSAPRCAGSGATPKNRSRISGGRS